MTMSKAQSNNWTVGRWLIESMDQWDRDFIDEEVRGYFEFDARGLDSFQFGYVQGQIDYRLGERDGKPAVEFSWDGRNEMDPAQGRGWLRRKGEELKGMFFIHLGDESGTMLTRETDKRRTASRKQK
jgi:hypothetical protein